MHLQRISTGNLERTGRRGGLSYWLILSISTLFALMALAVDVGNLWQARIELRNANDAIVLAVAQALQDDDLLSNRPGIMQVVVERSRTEATRYGLANPVLGQPLQLVENSENPAESDLVYGYLENSDSKDFQPTLDTSDGLINAVRVLAQRTRARGNPAGMYFGRMLGLPWADVVTSATAFVDRDVIGFRPQGQQPLPVIPLALLTDPTMTDPEAWESQVLTPTLSPDAQGSDEYVYDRTQRRFLRVGEDVAQGDGIFEMDVHIPLAGQPMSAEDQEAANGCFLQVQGDEDWSALTRQLAGGLTAADLVKMDGQFLLGWDNRLYLPGLPTAPGMDSPQLGQLLNALRTLQLTAEPRVWPLFATTRADGSGGGVTVVLQGFVAARVVRAELVTVQDNPKEPERQQLNLTLQPCMVSVGTAVTDFSRRHANPEVDLYNRYISKVRLVE